MKKYNKNLLETFANCVGIEKFQKGKVVFMVGDRPDKLYLIARGKVSVMIPQTRTEMLEAD